MEDYTEIRNGLFFFPVIRGLSFMVRLAEKGDFMEFFSFIEGIQTLQAMILLIGLVLLLVEAFMPGFGIAGGTGIGLLVLGIILTARSPFEAFAMVLLLLLFIALLILIVLRSAKKGTIAKKLILWSAARQEEGFSTSSDMTSLVGHSGIAVTILRPSGTGEFEGKRMDVVSEGPFIEAGTKIRVIRAEGRLIVVESVP